MNVGMIGLGKLGLPIAKTMALKHEVMGYDVLPVRGLFQQGVHRTNSIDHLVTSSEVIFVAVQTPHDWKYEGILPYQGESEDFNYSYLRDVAENIVKHVKPDQTVAIISTVLPGTLRREIFPILRNKCRICYNPFFIAMGTEQKDFLSPEFVLIGRDYPHDSIKLEEFYLAFHSEDKLVKMGIESAELTKVAYNCCISQKIALANALMEICHKVPGCRLSQVTGALKKATDRIVSPRYMDGGMGDSGGCHPRDGLAMSWLAKKLNLSYDPFAASMTARTKQTEWLADLIEEQHKKTGLPVVLLGKSYKPETDLTIGSCGILLGVILEKRGIKFSHYDRLDEISGDSFPAGMKTALYFIATKHREFKECPWPFGSAVIDPFRYIAPGPGVIYVGDETEV